MLIRLLLNGILDFFVKVNVGADDAVHLVSWLRAFFRFHYIVAIRMKVFHLN